MATPPAKDNLKNKWCVLYEMQPDGSNILVARPVEQVPPTVLKMPRVVASCVSKEFAENLANPKRYPCRVPPNDVQYSVYLPSRRFESAI